MERRRMGRVKPAPTKSVRTKSRLKPAYAAEPVWRPAAAPIARGSGWRCRPEAACSYIEVALPQDDTAGRDGAQTNGPAQAGAHEERTNEESAEAGLRGEAGLETGSCAD